MSTNCLVTKLKGTVNNPNLPYLGEFKVDLIPSLSSPTLNHIQIFLSAGKTINWESTVDMFDKTSTDQTRVNLGRSGSFTGNENLFFDEAGTIRYWAKYDVATIFIQGLNSTLDLNQLDFDGGSIKLAFGGGYGFLSEISGTTFTIAKQSANYPQARMPISLDSNGYDNPNIVFEQDIQDLSYIDTLVRYIDKLTQPFDLAAPAQNVSVRPLIKSISLIAAQVTSLQGKVKVGNIENLGLLPNLTTIKLHNIPIESGSIVTALTPLTGLTNFNILGGKNVEDLADLFNAWKTAGKVSSSCAFYFNPFKFTVTGYPGLTTGQYTVTFDANGNWTVA